jgi:hypothetical protein
MEIEYKAQRQREQKKRVITETECIEHGAERELQEELTLRLDSISMAPKRAANSRVTTEIESHQHGAQDRQNRTEQDRTGHDMTRLRMGKTDWKRWVG